MKVYFVPFFMVMATTAVCQSITPSVVAVAGAVSSSDKMVLEWTVGEPMVETGVAGTTVLTQGFHQPLLLVKPVALAVNLPRVISVSVFPNPTAAALSVQLAEKADMPFDALLIDNWGRVLPGSKRTVNTASFSVDMRPLPQGTYFLRLLATNGILLGDYKVIKVN